MCHRACHQGVSSCTWRGSFGRCRRSCELVKHVKSIIIPIFFQYFTYSGYYTKSKFQILYEYNIKYYKHIIIYIIYKIYIYIYTPAKFRFLTPRFGHGRRDGSTIVQPATLGSQRFQYQYRWSGWLFVDFLLTFCWFFCWILLLGGLFWHKNHNKGLLFGLSHELGDIFRANHMAPQPSPRLIHTSGTASSARKALR